MEGDGAQAVRAFRVTRKHLVGQAFFRCVVQQGSES
jgi:hypothetical protein